MPPRANSEKIISLYADIFSSKKQQDECCANLSGVMDSSQVGPDYERYRYQIFKKAVKIVKTPQDLNKLVQFHDRILASIHMDSEEDITGYHHYYSPDNIYYWIRISGSVDDFLSIINSRIRETQARIIIEKNNRYAVASRSQTKRRKR